MRCNAEAGRQSREVGGGREAGQGVLVPGIDEDSDQRVDTCVGR